MAIMSAFKECALKLTRSLVAQERRDPREETISHIAITNPVTKRTRLHKKPLRTCNNSNQRLRRSH